MDQGVLLAEIVNKDNKSGVTNTFAFTRVM
jgi:hypothetical protein